MPQSTKCSKYYFLIIWAEARVACAHLRAAWILIMEEMHTLSYIKPSSYSSQCFLCVFFKSSFISLKKTFKLMERAFLSDVRIQNHWPIIPDSRFTHNSQQWVCSTLRVLLCSQLWLKHSIKLCFTHYFFNQTLLLPSLWRQKYTDRDKMQSYINNKLVIILVDNLAVLTRLKMIVQCPSM